MISIKRLTLLGSMVLFASVCLAQASKAGSVDSIKSGITVNTTQPIAGADKKMVKIYKKQETVLFIATAKETLAALLAKNKELMIMKLTDLESAWDDAEDKLRPRNDEQWHVIDKTLDQGINSLRSTHYDEVKGKEALEALLKALAEATE